MVENVSVTQNWKTLKLIISKRVCSFHKLKEHRLHIFIIVIKVCNIAMFKKLRLRYKELGSFSGMEPK